MATRTRFETKKTRILEQLGAPVGEYHDLSPKGSVDEPIRPLIADVNRLDGLVTTSSCSGRVSVFLEGKKTGSKFAELREDNEPEIVVAGPGGKGGGSWLFTSHEPVNTEQKLHHPGLISLFGLSELVSRSEIIPGPDCRYIHLKFEPMILHVLTASLDHAHKLLTAALSAGFRESGAVSLAATRNGECNPMVAVRSTGYSFDTIIGFQSEEGRNVAMVDERYLEILTNIANDRFEINKERIARFSTALLEQFDNPHEDGTSIPSSVKTPKPGWEDPDTRKQRKREEGLARQRALIAEAARNSLPASMQAVQLAEPR